MPDIDPQQWLDAILMAVQRLPHGVHILLVAVGVLAVRWALVPLIQAWRRR